MRHIRHRPRHRTLGPAFVALVVLTLLPLRKKPRSGSSRALFGCATISAVPVVFDDKSIRYALWWTGVQHEPVFEVLVYVTVIVVFVRTGFEVRDIEKHRRLEEERKQHTE